MNDIPPEGVRPFVFSDPAGKRWPRLRLMLFITAIVTFLATVLFVQTLFVVPRLQLPFSLRQLKGQLKTLQKKNPAGQVPAAEVQLWKKLLLAHQTGRKSTPAPAVHPRKRSPDAEVRLAFYTNGDPYCYASLVKHAAQLTHVCPEWMSLVDGEGHLQVDADSRLPRLAASRGFALLPLLSNLVGDKWQPEAVENLAHGPPERQQRFIQNVREILRGARATGVVVDWEQVDPAYKRRYHCPPR